MNATRQPGSDTVASRRGPVSTPRLLRPPTGAPEDYADVRGAGGYQHLDDPDALLDEVDRSGLLGRGGAAFPLAVKLRTVRDAGRSGGDTVVVANGEEGEPASVKDRWLLRNRPHLVLDGLRLAARIVGADRAYVYVSDAACGRAPSTTRSTSRTALDGLDGQRGDRRRRLRRRRGDRRRARDQRRARPNPPTSRRARSSEGVGGHPTLVSNVETLANLPFILRHGATRSAPRAPRPRRAPSWPPSPAPAGPPPSTRFRTARRSPICLPCTGFRADTCSGVLMGGYFAGLLNREVLDATLDHETHARAWAADSGAAPSPSSPTTARWPSRQR